MPPQQRINYQSPRHSRRGKASSSADSVNNGTICSSHSSSSNSKSSGSTMRKSQQSNHKNLLKEVTRLVSRTGHSRIHSTISDTSSETSLTLPEDSSLSSSFRVVRVSKVIEQEQQQQEHRARQQPQPLYPHQRLPQIHTSTRAPQRGGLFDLSRLGRDDSTTTTNDDDDIITLRSGPVDVDSVIQDEREDLMCRRLAKAQLNCDGKRHQRVVQRFDCLYKTSQPSSSIVKPLLGRTNSANSRTSKASTNSRASQRSSGPVDVDSVLEEYGSEDSSSNSGDDKQHLKSSKTLSKCSLSRTASLSSKYSQQSSSTGPVDIDSVYEVYGEDNTLTTNGPKPEKIEVVKVKAKDEHVVSRRNISSTAESKPENKKVTKSNAKDEHLGSRRSLSEHLRGASDDDIQTVTSSADIQTVTSSTAFMLAMEADSVAASEGPVDVDEFIPSDSYYAYDRHYIVLDETEFSRGLAGYEVGFEPETIWDYESYQARRKFSEECIPIAIDEEDSDEFGFEYADDDGFKLEADYRPSIPRREDAQLTETFSI